MDVERSYLRFQDFGMAIGTTIVALFLGMLFRALCREEIDSNLLNWGMAFAWSLCVYLNFAAMCTQELVQSSQVVSCITYVRRRCMRLLC